MKKAYKIHHLVNWFFGNYCARKCYEDCGQQYICWKKLQEFAGKCKDLELRHKEFLDLFCNEIKICRLPPKERRKPMFWKEFMRRYKL